MVGAIFPFFIHKIYAVILVTLLIAINRRNLYYLFWTLPRHTFFKNSPYLVRGVIVSLDNSFLFPLGFGRAVFFVPCVCLMA